MNPTSARGQEETPLIKHLLDTAYFVISIVLYSQPNCLLHYHILKGHRRDKLNLFRKSCIFRLFKIQRVCFKIKKHNYVRR